MNIGYVCVYEDEDSTYADQINLIKKYDDDCTQFFIDFCYSTFEDLRCKDNLNKLLNLLKHDAYRIGCYKNLYCNDLTRFGKGNHLIYYLTILQKLCITVHFTEEKLTIYPADQLSFISESDNQLTGENGIITKLIIMKFDEDDETFEEVCVDIKN